MSDDMGSGIAKALLVFVGLILLGIGILVGAYFLFK